MSLLENLLQKKLASATAPAVSHRQTLSKPSSVTHQEASLTTNATTQTSARASTSTSIEEYLIEQDRTRIPGKEFLRLYYGKTRRSLCIAHMEGVALLADWLGPFSWPEPTAPATHLMWSYEAMELCRILKCAPAQLQEAQRLLMQEGFYGAWP